MTEGYHTSKNSGTKDRNIKSNKERDKNEKHKRYNNKEKPDNKLPHPKQGYEYVSSSLPKLPEGCCFGDEYFFYEGEQGNPKYEDMDEKWNMFAQWIEHVREKNMTAEDFDDSHPDRVGRETAKWARKHDFYAVYLIILMNWEAFRDTYLLEEGCPEIVMEFVRGLMYEKMTEEEMWGSIEERQPKGKLIIYKEEYLPKEGEDTGDLEIIYEPIVHPPGYEEREEDICPFEFYPKEKILFPKIPLFFEG